MGNARWHGTAEPEVGSYFVANYPPFSTWSARRSIATRARPDALQAGVPLGLYCTSVSSAAISAISACTNKNAQEVEAYWTARASGWYNQKAAWQRAVDFVYVGGGTPSFLPRQLSRSWIA
jgi:oxygen-independent coproporphyrinogen-3 oxidase